MRALQHSLAFMLAATLVTGAVAVTDAPLAHAQDAAPSADVKDRAKAAFKEGKKMFAAGDYAGPQVYLSGNTPSTYRMSGYTTLGWRDYFHGEAWSLNGGVSWAPAALLRLDVGYDMVHTLFDDARSDFDSVVVNGRATLGFSPKIGLRLFGAYNLLGDLVQLQTRLRWIYMPGSDLFLVYQLNIDDDTGRARFVSMIAKTQFRLDLL